MGGYLSTRRWFVDLRNHQRPLAVLLLLVHSVGEETGIRWKGICGDSNIGWNFLLQLDSHKSVAMSINVVGSHLAEHAASPSRAEAMESRLAAVNGQWDAVCEQATLWQTRLQTALLENGEFHATIQELLVWLDSTTAKVREAEPVDLRVDRATLEAKHSQLVELSRDLA